MITRPLKRKSPFGLVLLVICLNILARKFGIAALGARGHLVVFIKTYFGTAIGAVITTTSGLFAGFYYTLFHNNSPFSFGNFSIRIFLSLIRYRFTFLFLFLAGFLTIIWEFRVDFWVASIYNYILGLQGVLCERNY